MKKAMNISVSTVGRLVPRPPSHQAPACLGSPLQAGLVGSHAHLAHGQRVGGHQGNLPKGITIDQNVSNIPTLRSLAIHWDSDL